MNHSKYAQVGAAFEQRNGAPQLLNELELLHPPLASHHRDDETFALPAIERTIGEAGWKAYRDEIRGGAARG